MSLNRWLRTLPLGVKLPLTVAAIVYSVTLIVVSVVMLNDWRHMEEDISNHARQLTSAIAAMSRDMLMQHDYWQAYEQLLHVLHESPSSWDIDVVVVDNAGKVFISNRPRQWPVGLVLDTATVAPSFPEAENVLLDRWGEKIYVTDDVVYQEMDLGRVYLAGTLNAVFAGRRKLILLAFGVATLIAMVGVMIGMYMSRRMAEPLNAMAEALPYLERGDYYNLPEIPVRDRDEIGQLAMLFNQMRREIRMRVDIEKQMARAERLSAMGRLAAAAAHEIRNPLGGVFNSLRTLRKHAYDPAVRQSCLDTMEGGLRQIDHVVGSMLGFSKDKGVAVDLNREALNQVVALLEVEASRVGVEIKLDWRLDDVVPVPASPVTQLVFNLGANAVHASSSGDVVNIRLYPFAEAVGSREMVIEVEDQGCGIPQEAKERIFEPFWSAAEGGTGLGLWVCCRVVDELNGLISVESEPGVGTLFAVRLPLMHEGSGGAEAGRGANDPDDDDLHPRAAHA